MPPRRPRSLKRRNPPPQPEPEGKKRLSPTSIGRCSRFLSHHCHRSLPPNCTSCVHCLRSQRYMSFQEKIQFLSRDLSQTSVFTFRLEELESWDKILDEEFETRFKDLNLVVDMLPISMDKLNIMFRLEEIKTMTGDHLDAVLKKKSLTNPENAEKARALLQHEAVENLYDDEKESLNREFEELRLKKEQMERDLAMIPKASKFLSDATRKRKDGDAEDDTATIKIV